MGQVCRGCSNVATVVSDSVEQDAVIKKINLVLNPKAFEREDRARSVRDRMGETMANCRSKLGEDSPVYLMAAWALSRIHGALKDYRQQERLLNLVDAFYKSGGDLPFDGPPSDRFHPRDDSKFAGFRAIRIAQELAKCYNNQIDGADDKLKAAQKVVDQEERVYEMYKAAPGAPADDKTLAKVKLCQLLSNIPQYADKSIALIGEAMDEIDAQFDGFRDDEKKSAKALYEKIAVRRGALLSKAEKWAELEANHKQLLAAIERDGATPQPRTLVPALFNLSTALFKQQKYAEMEPFLKRALALDPSDDDLTNLHCICLTATKRFEEAETTLRGILTRKFDANGANHMATLGARLAVARVLEQQDKDAESEEIFLAMLASCDAIYGEKHPAAHTIVRQAVMHIGTKMGKVDEAYALQSEWLRKWQEWGMRTGTVMAYLQALDSAASSYEAFETKLLREDEAMRLKLWDEAEAVRKKLCGIYVQISAQQNKGVMLPQFHLYINRHVALLEKMGMEEKADELRREHLVSALKRAASSSSKAEEAKEETNEEKI